MFNFTHAQDCAPYARVTRKNTGQSLLPAKAATATLLRETSQTPLSAAGAFSRQARPLFNKFGRSTQEY